jgi:PEP-CTERM motif
MKRSSFRTSMPFVLIAWWALSAASGAYAQVTLFNNLGNQPQGFQSVDANNWSATRFNTDANNYMLTSATLKLYTESGGTGTFFVKLFSDTAGQPGTALATLASGPNPLSVGFQATDVAFNGLNQPLLANTNYWIVFGDNPGPALDLRWSAVNPGGSGVGYQALRCFTGNQGISWGGFDTDHAMQMQLTASVVPEPGSMLLAGLGLASIWRFRRKKQIVV